MKTLSLAIALLLTLPGLAQAQKSKSPVHYQRNSKIVPAAIRSRPALAATSLRSKKARTHGTPITWKARDELALMRKIRPVRDAQICLMLQLIWMTDSKMAGDLGFDRPQQSRDCKGTTLRPPRLY